MKLNELMKEYFTNPIKEFREVRSVALLCRDPHKKCVIALLNPEKRMLPINLSRSPEGGAGISEGSGLRLLHGVQVLLGRYQLQR